MIFDALKSWVLITFAVACTSAMGDSLLDFTVFEPPESAQRKLPDPVVSWLIKPNASTYCQHVHLKDGFVTRPEGCVFWQLQASRCTIVTPTQTGYN